MVATLSIPWIVTTTPLTFYFPIFNVRSLQKFAGLIIKCSRKKRVRKISSVQNEVLNTRRALSNVLLFTSLLIATTLSGCQIELTSATDSGSLPSVTSAERSISPNFSTSIYPSPVPVADGVVWGPACPNPIGLDKVEQPTKNEVLKVLDVLSSNSLEPRRQAADPSLWSSLGKEQWAKASAEQIGVVQPAVDSPYAELLANACGEEVVNRSWWVQICPGNCEDQEVTQPASLTTHLYLLQRQGQWLAWTAQ